MTTHEEHAKGERYEGRTVAEAFKALERVYNARPAPPVDEPVNTWRDEAPSTTDVVERWRRLHRARARGTVVYLVATEAKELAGLIRGSQRTPLRLYGSYVVVVPEEVL